MVENVIVVVVESVVLLVADLVPLVSVVDGELILVNRVVGRV